MLRLAGRSLHTRGFPEQTPIRGQGVHGMGGYGLEGLCPRHRRQMAYQASRARASPGDLQQDGPLPLSLRSIVRLCLCCYRFRSRACGLQGFGVVGGYRWSCRPFSEPAEYARSAHSQRSHAGSTTQCSLQCPPLGGAGKARRVSLECPPPANSPKP